MSKIEIDQSLSADMTGPFFFGPTVARWLADVETAPERQEMWRRVADESERTGCLIVVSDGGIDLVSERDRP